MLTPNDKGKYKKDEVIENGYKILPYGMTATEVQKLYKVKIPKERRVELCMGFICKSAWRGCSPVYDIQKILKEKQDGRL